LVTDARTNRRAVSPNSASTPDGPTTAAAAVGTGQSDIASKALMAEQPNPFRVAATDPIATL
jgi:hypothetical protein